MRIHPFRAVLAAAFALLAAVPAGATKYAAEYLKIPVGARAVGMGGAFSAIADDASAPFWNPAGMVYLPYREVFLQHAEQFGSLVNHNFGAGVWPMQNGEERRSAIGVTATWVGGAFSAIADDASAPFWNPAGMVYLPYREVFLQHAEQFGSLVNHNFGAGVWPMQNGEERRSAIGVTATWVGVSDIPITPRPGGLRPNVDFQDDGIDNNPLTSDYGQQNGRWDPGERLLIAPEDLFLASSTDLAFTVSYARQRGRHLAWGATVKFLRQSLPDTIPGEHVTSFGAGADLGILYMPHDAITLSAIVHDLTTTYITWSNGTREQAWPSIVTGAGIQFQPAEGHALTWGTDLAWDLDGRDLDSQLKLGFVNADVRLGLEYWYRSTLALRSGIQGKDLAFGAGLRYRHLGVDYAASLNRFFAANDPAFPEDHNLETTHLISGSFSW